MDSLYNLHYFKPGEPFDSELAARDLQQAISKLSAQYRPGDGVPDAVATISHRHRIEMNAYINGVLADRVAVEHRFRLTWTGEDLPRCTIQPQSAWFWPGMIVVGCGRGRGATQAVMNGVFYEILSFDDSNVTLRMHSSCVGSLPAAPEPFKMTRANFLLGLRLTHALPYNYFQGRTLKDQKLLLMDLKSPHFTMRHLIMGMGRVTKGEDLWLCGPALQKSLRALSRAAMASAERGSPLATQAEVDAAELQLEAEEAAEAADLGGDEDVELLESDDEDELPLDVPEADDDLFE
jgi:hypothetical protein